MKTINNFRKPKCVFQWSDMLSGPVVISEKSKLSISRNIHLYKKWSRSTNSTGLLLSILLTCCRYVCYASEHSIWYLSSQVGKDTFSCMHLFIFWQLMNISKFRVVSFSITYVHNCFGAVINVYSGSAKCNTYGVLLTDSPVNIVNKLKQLKVSIIYFNIS